MSVVNTTAPSPLPVALQLWSIREDVTRDFAGCMRAVARMGFAGVELAGSFGGLSAGAAAAVLAEAGLRVSGMHVTIEALRRDVLAVADEAQVFGCAHVICPWYPAEYLSSVSACEVFGAELNALGAKLRGRGVRLHYHHHDHELKVLGGRYALDWILDAAEPRHLGCQSDVYWLHMGGADPERFLRRQGARIQLVHLKDAKELGCGPVQFGPIFSALDQIGAVEWLVIEQEDYSHAPLEAVEISFRQLRTWGRA